MPQSREDVNRVEVGTRAFHMDVTGRRESPILVIHERDPPGIFRNGFAALAACGARRGCALDRMNARQPPMRRTELGLALEQVEVGDRARDGWQRLEKRFGPRE